MARAGSATFTGAWNCRGTAWRVVSVVLCLALFGALWSLLALIPLKSTEVVTLLVDKATGFVEVARPLEEGGPISQREAVTQAAIVRYIRARETYDPPALRDNFELASLLSAATASKELTELYSPGESKQSGEALGSDGTHQGLRQERELPDATAGCETQKRRRPPPCAS